MYLFVVYNARSPANGPWSVCVCMNVCMYVCVCTYVCMNVCTYVYIYMCFIIRQSKQLMHYISMEATLYGKLRHNSIGLDLDNSRNPSFARDVSSGGKLVTIDVALSQNIDALSADGTCFKTITATS